MTDDSGPPQHWTCLQCGERVPNEFAVCWACGASREGVPDPSFRHADAAPDREAVPQHDTQQSAKLRTGTALVLVILGTLVFLADAKHRDSQWFGILIWLALWGLAALVWPKRPPEET